MEQQPSRRRRGRGSEDEGTTGREQGPSVVDPRRRPPEGSTWGAPWPAPVFMVTVDLQGFFHVAPHAGRGPFRSVGEALLATETMLSRRKVPISSDDDDGEHSTIGGRGTRILDGPARPAYYDWWAGWPTQRALNLHGPMAWIYTRKVALRPRPERPRLSPWSRWEYHIELRNGLFFAHPPYVGGPFHSLGEAAAAIKCHLACASATQQLMKGYYFILKNGLFHVRPDGAGGPFKQLDDAMNAVACHRGWIQLRKERIRRRKQFIDEIDPAVLVPRMKELVEMIKNCKRDGQCPKPEKRREEKRCDPAISEEADRFERIVAEKQLIENGMKWMENEVLQAFETYKESSRYQGSEYEFVKLDMQCLIHDSSSKSYHHYNFTMRKKSYSYIRKKKEKMSWDYQLFFAEVKPTKEGKKIICCPLQSDENGPCFGCQNVGIDLRHPTSGCYEKGEEKSGFPYDRSSGSDY